MADKTELDVAKVSQKMLQTALLNEIKSSGLNLSDGPKDRKNKVGTRLTPASKSTAHRRMVRGQNKLRGIAIHMGKHMFVQNHGGNMYRDSHDVVRKGKTFKRKGSRLSLKPKDIVNSAVSKSGVMEYLSKEISEIRAEEIVTQIERAFK